MGLFNPPSMPVPRPTLTEALVGRGQSQRPRTILIDAPEAPRPGLLARLWRRLRGTRARNPFVAE